MSDQSMDTDQSVGPHDVRCRVGERIWTEAPAWATIFISEVSRVTRDRHMVRQTLLWATFSIIRDADTSLLSHAPGD